MNSESWSGEDEASGMGSLLSNLPVIFWERRWWVLAPLTIGLLASLASILLIDPVYRSNSLMLVQSSQLPADVTGQLNGEMIDRRIARIRQQVTSRPDLIALIERHNLYQDDRKNTPISEIVDEMRKAITLTPTSVELPGNQADQRTIAFDLAFQYAEPVAAQAVAQDLMDKILELDASGNIEQATNTAQFLSEQAKGLEEKIAGVQGQISSLTQRYGGVIGKGGTSFIGNLGSYDTQIAALQRDNASLIAQKSVASSADTRDPVVANAESALAAARAVYADTHPDVVVAKQRLAEAKELAKSNASKMPLETIDQQIAFNNSQIAALRRAKSQEQAQVNAGISAQAQAPAAQQQIEALQQNLSGLNEQYQAVQGRLMAARAGVRAEDEQMAERLTVVEPPIVPEEPIWPDRLLIMLLGIGGGLAVGLMLPLVLELIFRPVRDPDTLAKITGKMPLGFVPVIKSSGKPRSSRFHRLLPSALRRSRAQ